MVYILISIEPYSTNTESLINQQCRQTSQKGYKLWKEKKNESPSHSSSKTTSINLATFN